ncbi:unnamed protein product, partial [marine sediment metagenome]
GQFRKVCDDGEEMVMRLLIEENSFSPDHRMAFGAEPRLVPKLPAAEIKKMGS